MIERHSAIEGYLDEASYDEGAISGSVLANGTIYFSGIAAIGSDLDVVAPEDMGGQITFCLDVLERGLAQHDADWSNLVSVVCYVTDEDAYMENYGLFVEKFAGNPPTVTSIGVPHLSMPGLLIEVVPIAAK